MLILHNMLKYRIAAVFIFMHNHSLSALFPRIIGKVWYKLEPSLMEAQSHTRTEIALFQTKKELLDIWKLVPSKQREDLLLLLRHKSKAGSKLMP